MPYKKAVEKADIITVPSVFLKEKLNLENAVVIPNAVLAKDFNLVEHKEKDTLKLITVTRFHFLEKAKGVLNLIKIINKVKKKIEQEIKYVVIGGGPYLNTIKKDIKNKNLNFKIDFTNEIKEPKNILEDSDIFLYYSEHDNFPYVLLEAMACGLPLITNKFGAVNEFIENKICGFVAENEKIYIKYLIELLTDWKLRRNIGDNARKSIEEKNNWNSIIEKYIEIYQNLDFKY